MPHHYLRRSSSSNNLFSVLNMTLFFITWALLNFLLLFLFLFTLLQMNIIIALMLLLLLTISFNNPTWRYNFFKIWLSIGIFLLYLNHNTSSQQVSLLLDLELSFWGNTQLFWFHLVCSWEKRKIFDEIFDFGLFLKNIFLHAEGAYNFTFLLEH